MEYSFVSDLGRERGAHNASGPSSVSAMAIFDKAAYMHVGYIGMHMRRRKAVSLQVYNSHGQEAV
jgi:hypothetical protein